MNKTYKAPKLNLVSKLSAVSQYTYALPWTYEPSTVVTVAAGPGTGPQYERPVDDGSCAICICPSQ